MSPLPSDPSNPLRPSGNSGGGQSARRERSGLAFVGVTPNGTGTGARRSSFVLAPLQGQHSPEEQQEASTPPPTVVVYGFVDVFTEVGKPVEDIGAVFLIDKPIVTIGRGFECNIKISDLRVSRLQAKLCWNEVEGKVYLVQHGSKNLTRIFNDDGSKHKLQDGERRAVGDEMIFMFGRNKLRWRKFTGVVPSIRAPIKQLRNSRGGSEVQQRQSIPTVQPLPPALDQQEQVMQVEEQDGEVLQEQEDKGEPNPTQKQNEQNLTADKQIDNKVPEVVVQHLEPSADTSTPAGEHIHDHDYNYDAHTEYSLVPADSEPESESGPVCADADKLESGSPSSDSDHGPEENEKADADVDVDTATAGGDQMDTGHVAVEDSEANTEMTVPEQSEGVDQHDQHENTDNKADNEDGSANDVPGYEYENAHVEVAIEEEVETEPLSEPCASVDSKDTDKIGTYVKTDEEAKRLSEPEAEDSDSEEEEPKSPTPEPLTDNEHDGDEGGDKKSGSVQKFQITLTPVKTSKAPTPLEPGSTQKLELKTDTERSCSLPEVVQPSSRVTLTPLSVPAASGEASSATTMTETEASTIKLPEKNEKFQQVPVLPVLTPESNIGLLMGPPPAPAPPAVPAEHRPAAAGIFDLAFPIPAPSSSTSFPSTSEASEYYESEIGHISFDLSSISNSDDFDVSGDIAGFGSGFPNFNLGFGFGSDSDVNVVNVCQITDKQPQQQQGQLQLQQLQLQPQPLGSLEMAVVVAFSNIQQQNTVIIEQLKKLNSNLEKISQKQQQKSVEEDGKVVRGKRARSISPDSTCNSNADSNGVKGEAAEAESIPSIVELKEEGERILKRLEQILPPSAKRSRQE